MRMVVIIALVFSWGCNAAPHEPVFFDVRDLTHPVLKAVLIREADVIVAGKVAAVQYADRDEPLPGVTGIRVRRTEIGINVENAIKGHSGAVESFYCFTVAPSSTGILKPAYRPRLNEKRIFFLMSESGRLRQVRDVLEWYSLPVFSGEHPSLQSGNGETPQELIARVLLTLGEEFNGEELAISLFQSAVLARTLTSDTLTRSLLNDLLTAPNRRVRAAAASTLAALNAGQAAGTLPKVL
jgi:hypothetical protein